jgi:hypothetical protein
LGADKVFKICCFLFLGVKFLWKNTCR